MLVNRFVCLFRYLRFVAEQNPEVGWLMRRGLEAYYQGDMYDKHYWTAAFLFAGLNLYPTAITQELLSYYPHYTIYYQTNLSNFKLCYREHC